MVPVVDLAVLLPNGAADRRYDGQGEILRLRAAGGYVGLWIDRTERIVERGSALDAAIQMIEPERLVQLGMVAPVLAGEASHPLGDANDLAAPVAATAVAAFFLVEAGGERVRLSREAVLEFVEPPPLGLPSPAHLPVFSAWPCCAALHCRCRQRRCWACRKRSRCSCSR